jgi:V-type H+-transporting ATPase subunit a
MYGDIGHASLVTVGALFLLLTAEKNAEDRSLDEMVSGMYKARYMLFMMGACAVYCGFIYNDFFSLTWDLFGSGYQFNEQSISGQGGEAARATIADGEEAHLVKGNYGDPQYIYPFGVDPAWHMSSNDLLFFNSLKMKFSVIVGIVHMSVGIIIKGMNCWYFNQKLDFFAEFLPQILFALSLFGYMIILIFIKWSINWDDRMALGSCGYDSDGVHGNCNLGSSDSCYSISGKECDINTPLVDMCPLDYGGTGDGCQPPNLITTLMNIALKPGNVDEPMFAGQEPLQLFLIVFAFLCVPWMLIIKPYVLWQQHAHEHQHGHFSTEVAASTTVQEKGSQTINPLAPASASAYGALSTEPEQEGMHDESVSKASNAGNSDDEEDGLHEYVEEHSMTEICIHQGIETIEFVLGMVSNTASYLRLWALTLAHSELAHVFWEKCMVTSISTYNSFAVVVGFFIFAGVTFGVLLVMDVLECFLHAMRLHWVEFQNKFYKADGIKFKPFDLKEMLLDSRF